MASLYGKGTWGVATYSYAPATNEHLVTGNIGPLVTLGASLSGTKTIAGNLTPRIILAASASLVSGTFWTPVEPCPPTMWTPTEPCAPVDWQETEFV